MTAELTRIRPIRFDAALDDWMQERAAALGVTRSAMVRMIMRREKGDPRWADEMNNKREDEE